MSNYKKITKESNTNVALVILCQDYIYYDDELMGDKTIKRSVNSEVFWLELSEHLFGTIRKYLESSKVVEGEFDEFEETDLREDEILGFVLDINNRFELNDMILDTVETWLKLRGNR